MPTNGQHGEKGDSSEKIGSFQVVRPLGAGGMGEVLLVYDARLERHVALKRIREPSLKSSDDQQRFLREARAAAQLNHPGIVQIHDIFQDSSGLNIVMEYVEGHSIAKLLREGSLSQAQAIGLGIGILEALNEAHKQGIVHRDLKAENVMVTPAGRTKILDFGLAKHLALADQGLTAPGQIMGTTRIMSPEQTLGEPVDQRTDLFSFGVLLYEMLSGQSPFMGDNFFQTLQNVQTKQQTPLSQLDKSIPASLSELVNWLLQKKPDDRPLNAMQITQMLRRFANDSQLFPSLQGWSSVPSGSQSVSGSQLTLPLAHKPKGKRLVYLGLLIAGVLIATLLFLVIQGRSPQHEPLRVAVLKPEFTSENPEAKLAVMGVLETILDTLTTLEGMSPLDPNSIGNQGDTTEEVARAVAADEVLSTKITEDGFFLRITLRRLRGSDGSILWTETFEVPNKIDDSHLAADAVVVKIRSAFPKHPTRPGTLAMRVRDEDYADFLRLSQELLTFRATFDESRKARLEAIMRGSPDFLPAYTLAGDNALIQFNNSGDRDHLRQAAAYRDRLGRIAPQDLRYLELHFGITLAQKDYPLAETVLGMIERLAPRAVSTLILRARLQEKQSNLPAAIATLRDAVSRRPYWRGLYRLANLEIQTGQIDQARTHLEKLLEIAPGNIWGLTSLASAELVHGDLNRAETLFLEATRLLPHKSFFANLGTTRYYLGHFEGAVAAYSEALALEPDDATLWLGLADATLAQGQRALALEHYTAALTKLEAMEAHAPLDPINTLVKAQCLAHLGQLEQAVAITLKTLQNNSDHGEVAFQAALVYVLAGESRSVLACTRSALEKGIQLRWFASPLFEPIQQDPRFRAILAEFDKDRKG